MKNRLLWVMLLFCLMVGNIQAQDAPMVRLVKIVVTSSSLDTYTQLLKAQMNTAIAEEEGVLEYHVVTEKNQPNVFTLIEIYRDSLAYWAHLKTPHFLAYKTATANMVQSLTLLDALLVAQVVK